MVGSARAGAWNHETVRGRRLSTPHFGAWPQTLLRVLSRCLSPSTAASLLLSIHVHVDFFTHVQLRALLLCGFGTYKSAFCCKPSQTLASARYDSQHPALDCGSFAPPCRQGREDSASSSSCGSCCSVRTKSEGFSSKPLSWSRASGYFRQL